MRLLSLATLLLFLATGCQHVPVVTKGIKRQEAAPLPPPPARHAGTINSLPSRWMDADSRKSKKVTIIFVPGSGNQSLAGIQVGNGFSPYSKPIELGTIWQEKVAQSGFDVLAYDKRSGTSGPSALSQDVDAACEAVWRRFGSGRDIVLWTSEQGTQVVLNSKCLDRVSALVFVSPIVDALDRVWVLGLKEAGYRDRSLSLSATFESIRKGQFEPDAKVMGASLAFWKDWLTLAEKTPKRLETLYLPTLFVVGEDDAWMGTYGKKLLERVAAGTKKRKIVVVSKADRNLLHKEALSQGAVETILQALANLGKS